MICLSFCEEIHSVDHNDYSLVPYDVCNLVRCIPLQERIEAAVELTFKNNPLLN